MTELLLKIFIKNRKETSSGTVREKYGALASGVGIACNLLLFVLKLVLGILSGAVAVLADAFNNLSDIGSSVVTMLGFRIAKKPADKGHPFGHGRMEYMSAFMVAILIILVGIELLKSSAEKLFSPSPLQVSPFLFIGLVGSVLVKLWLGLFQRRLGISIGSSALIATARDSANDCISTCAVLASVIVFKATGFNPDPYVGILVALFILWSGYCTARDTLSPLLGEPPPKELVEGIENTILEHKDFCGIHDLIVHNYGPGRRFASVHVEVPQEMDMLYCHEQIDDCERELHEKLGIETVIHMDPIAVNDPVCNTLRERVADDIKSINRELNIHDFRVVHGTGHTNLIFDIVVPQGFKISDSELKAKVNELVKRIDKTYFCVINVDRNYIGD